MTVLPATLNIEVTPFQTLYFDSATHTADERGLILNVPYDTAKTMIEDKQHPAREATDEDLATSSAAAPTPEPAAASEPVVEPEADADAGKHDTTPDDAE